MFFSKNKEDEASFDIDQGVPESKPEFLNLNMLGYANKKLKGANANKLKEYQNGGGI